MLSLDTFKSNLYILVTISVSITSKVGRGTNISFPCAQHHYLYCSPSPHLTSCQCLFLLGLSVSASSWALVGPQNYIYLP